MNIFPICLCCEMYFSRGFKKSKFCCFQGPNECLIPVPVRYVPNTFYAIKLEIWGCLLLYQNCVKHTCKLLTLNDVRLKNPSDDVNNIRTPLFSFFSQSNPNEIIISEGDRCDYLWYIWDTDVKWLIHPGRKRSDTQNEIFSFKCKDGFISLFFPFFYF